MLSADYVAGVIDADGHIGWRGDKYASPDVGVTNTSAVLMDALVATLGGSAGLERRSCPDRCTEDHLHRRQDIGRWHLTGYRAVLLLETIADRLVIKGDRARDAVERYSEHLLTMERPARRQHHIEKEREWWEQNMKGWD